MIFFFFFPFSGIPSLLSSAPQKTNFMAFPTPPPSFVPSSSKVTQVTQSSQSDVISQDPLWPTGSLTQIYHIQFCMIKQCRVSKSCS